MSQFDINNATDDQIRKELQDTYGIKAAHNASLETLKVKYFEASGVDPDALLETTTVVSTSADAEGVEKKSERPKMMKIKIMMGAGKLGKEDVKVGFQGKSYLLKRNEPAEVPYGVYEVLRNAVETQYEQKEDGTLIGTEVPSYPFMVL